MFSSDEDSALPLEKWLRSKLHESSSLEADSNSRDSVKDMIQKEHEKSILTGKEAKKLEERDFEQYMEDALDEFDDLDQVQNSDSNTQKIDIKNKSSHTKHVKFAENIDVNQNTSSTDGQRTEEVTDPEIEEESSEGHDPFYDPEADDEDERWVQNERVKHLKTDYSNQSDKKESDGGSRSRRRNRTAFSDAILSCPACMTIVCIDCQRHEFYANQYRAMFTMNCKVELNEVLHVTEKAKKKRSKKRGGGKFKTDEEACTNSNILAEGMKCMKKEVVNEDSRELIKLEQDQFHPVKCEVCTTEIAVYDREEIFHFFNIIASLS